MKQLSGAAFAMQKRTRGLGIQYSLVRIGHVRLQSKAVALQKPCQKILSMLNDGTRFAPSPYGSQGHLRVEKIPFLDTEKNLNDYLSI